MTERARGTYLGGGKVGDGVMERCHRGVPVGELVVLIGSALLSPCYFAKSKKYQL